MVSKVGLLSFYVAGCFSLKSTTSKVTSSPLKCAIKLNVSESGISLLLLWVGVAVEEAGSMEAFDLT